MPFLLRCLLQRMADALIYKAPRRDEMRKWVFCVIAVILVVIGYFTFNFINSRFTNKRWLSNPDMRYKMIDNLESEHSLKGKTQQEVIAMLGEPDNTWEHGSEEGHYVYFQYYIGPKDRMYAIMHEPDMYLIAFCNGIVVDTSVQPT